MFDFVRTHTKAMQVLLFLLIFPSFVLVGINGYNRMHERGETVAKVDGKEITQQEWDQAHAREADRIRRQMPNVDAKLLDSPQAKYATLERMVRDRVIAAAAAKDHIVTSDARLARDLQQNPVIASLRGPDGKLDMERYRQLVAAQGMTPQMYEDAVRADLAARQVIGGITASTFATAAQAAPTLNAFFERREIQVARFPASDYTSRVSPTDAEIEAYYKAHPQLFQAPEQADVEYVMLDVDTLMKTIPVNESELRTYYEQNVAKNQGQEERRASHILVAVPKNASADERAKAKAKAQQLDEQAKKNPDAFAELAKKNSDDKASAANGGDLDFFARGAMTKPFEDAVFSMKKGEVSGVVESDFGYHIIKLTDVREPKKQTFEDVRAKLEDQMRRQQAQRKFAEVADTFSNTVYEQADSLKPVADKLKLPIQTASNVRRVPAPGTAGPLANPKFLAALFAPDSVEKKRNTEAVEVAPSTLVAGRVVKYSPAHTQPLEEVKATVRDRLIAQRAAELARKDGMDKLAAWKANPAAANLPAAVTVSRQDAQKQPPKVVDAALRVDPTALPALSGVDLGDDGFAIVKVGKVVPREAPPAAQAQEEREQFGRWWGGAEMLAYYGLLKERFKAKILVPKPEPLVGS